MKPFRANEIGKSIRKIFDNKGEGYRMAKILVIDDDEIMNGMTVQLLSEAGYEAEGAQDGDCGLKLLGSKPLTW